MYIQDTHKCGFIRTWVISLYTKGKQKEEGNRGVCAPT